MKLSDYIVEREDRIVPDSTDLPYRKVSKISFSGELSVAKSKKSKTKMIIVQPKDFLVSGINASKGAMTINNSGETLCATIHYSSYEIDKLKVDQEFFSMIIKSNFFISKLKEMVRGGIKTELKPKHILDIEITLPSLDVQRKIMRDYHDQKDALSNDYFDTYTPKYMRRMKEQLYDKVLFDGKTVDPSTKNQHANHDSIPLLDVISEGPKNGHSPNPVNIPTDKKVLTLSATTSENFDENQFKYFKEEVPTDFIVKENDVFVQRGNSRDYVGVTAYCKIQPAEDVVYPDLMMRLRVDKTILPEYLVYFMNSGNVREYFRRKAKGTVDTMVKINQTTLKSLFVPLPDVDTQKLIIEKVSKIRAELSNLESSIGNIREKTDIILSAYFEKKFLESI